MMVVNNEVFNDISRMIRGIEFEGLDLEAEVIDRVGHMGSFLAQRHTMDAIRKGEVRLSPLWDRRTSEKATKEGFKTLQEKAKDRVRELLREHVPEPLDRDVEEEIGRIVKDASRTLAGRF